MLAALPQAPLGCRRFHAGAAAARRGAPQPARAAGAADEAADASDDADGFRAAYRRSRLAALRRGAEQPTYGEVVEVDCGDGGGEGPASTGGGGGGGGGEAGPARDLVSLVDGCHPDAACLLLIWDGFALPECAPWLAAWRALARARPRALFLTLRSGAASAHWEPLSLPALAVYRAGRTVAARVRLQARAGGEGGGGAGLGARPSAAEVGDWLEAEGYL